MRGCVVNLVGHGSCIMGHESVFVLVSGSSVTACDPLFTLVHIMLFELVIAIGRLLGLK